MKNKINKILFINTPRLTLEQLNEYSERSKYFWEVYPPLGLMYLSASLKKEKKGLSIYAIDLHIEGIKKSQESIKVNWEEIVKKKIDEINPDLIGISVMFGASFENAKNIGDFIKENYPSIILVSGGVHISALVKEKNDDLNFNDFVTVRESEKHFFELIEYLNKENDKVTGVYPINYRHVRDKKHFTEAASIVEHVDELPIPDFGLIDIKNYYKYGILSAAQTVEYDTPLATMQTVRGCTARCTFCSVRNFNGFGVRAHSPDRVLKEMLILYEKFGIRHIDFVDDDFTVSRERVIKICEMLIDKKLDLTWSVGNGVRLGTLDDELLTCMADSGCTYVSLGIESGDEKMLKEMKKPLTKKILEKKAPLLEKHTRIYYRANFITGYPGEKPEQLAATFDCAEKYSWDWSLFSLCKPLPDTELYNKILEGKFDDTKISKIKKDKDFNFENSKSSNNVEIDEEKEIFNLTYDKNLLINFKKNKNLKGRNIERAIKDFERVTKIAENHAFAWNGLIEGYKKTGQKDKLFNSQKKLKNILKDSRYWSKKFDELEFNINY